MLDAKPFPTMIQIANFLQKLTGKPAVLKPTKAAAFGQQGSPAFAGLYTEDEGTEPCAILMVDFAVALGLSGALMASPPAVTLEYLKKKQCGEMVPPTLYEILNVSGSLLNASGASHVRLTDMVQFSGKPTDAVAGLLAKVSQRIELEATVAPCPVGYLSIARVA